MSSVQSPCILVCTLDPKSGLCLGCGRSSREIANWTRYTDAERASVAMELDTRLRNLGLMSRKKS